MRLLMIALLCLPPLFAGEKTDAAQKALREQVDAITKAESAAFTRPKVADNGWAEYQKLFEASHKLIDDVQDGWLSALQDPRQDFFQHTPKDAETALQKTAAISAQIAAVAALPRIVCLYDDKQTGDDLMPVMKILAVSTIGTGRVMLLEQAGQHDAARKELRELARLAGKLDLRVSLMGMQLEAALRNSLLMDTLWPLLGKPGWGAAFGREILALMPLPAWDATTLLTHELRWMLATARQLFLVEGAQGLKDYPRKTADPDAYVATQITETGLFLTQLHGAIKEMRAKPPVVTTEAGLLRLAEIAASLAEQKSQEETLLVVRYPAVLSLRERLNHAAVNLRIMDMEKPIAGRMADAQKYVAGFPGLKVALDGNVAVIEIDQAHAAMVKGKFNTEGAVRIEPAAR
ncbi:MAG: hypothetical protein KF754_11810 [Planctomycetes bacterium]|nr:hypothetical protein [Planctomycetota bacterium]